MINPCFGFRLWPLLILFTAPLTLVLVGGYLGCTKPAKSVPYADPGGLSPCVS